MRKTSGPYGMGNWFPEKYIYLLVYLNRNIVRGENQLRSFPRASNGFDGFASTGNAFTSCWCVGSSGASEIRRKDAPLVGTWTIISLDVWRSPQFHALRWCVFSSFPFPKKVAHAFKIVSHFCYPRDVCATLLDVLVGWICIKWRLPKRDELSLFRSKQDVD